MFNNFASPNPGGIEDIKPIKVVLQLEEDETN